MKIQIFLNNRSLISLVLLMAVASTFKDLLDLGFTRISQIATLINYHYNRLVALNLTAFNMELSLDTILHPYRHTILMIPSVREYCEQLDDESSTTKLLGDFDITVYGPALDQLTLINRYIYTVSSHTNISSIVDFTQMYASEVQGQEIEGFIEKKDYQAFKEFLEQQGHEVSEKIEAVMYPKEVDMYLSIFKMPPEQREKFRNLFSGINPIKYIRVVDKKLKLTLFNDIIMFFKKV